MVVFQPSPEKPFGEMTKQIILVFKNEILVFVITNYFKYLHFCIFQIKFYQISQAYWGTKTNSSEKSKTMVILPNTFHFPNTCDFYHQEDQLIWSTSSKISIKTQNWSHTHLNSVQIWIVFPEICVLRTESKALVFSQGLDFSNIIWVCFNIKYQIQIFSNTLKTIINKSKNTKCSGSRSSTNPNITK